MQLILRGLIPFVSIIVLLCSCEESDTHPNTDKSVFKVNFPANISSLDPAFAKDLNNINAVNQIFNGLVQMDENLNIIPCLASSWDISEDGLEYTFHIRQDVKFHDHEAFEAGKGRLVNASDFKHSFYRITDKDVASPGAWIFNNVDFQRNLGFEAPDDSTFKIYLKNAFPPFLGLLTMQYCSVTPFEVVEYYGEEFGEHPVGTGPFKFNMWKDGVKLILHKNEQYWELDNEGNRLPYLDAVSVSFVKDKKSSFFEFLKGDLDYLLGIDPTYKDEILTRSGKLQGEYRDRITMRVEPALNTEYLGILMDPRLDLVQNSAMKKKAIRMAINYGINRKEMITYLRNNIGVPANAGFIPAGMPSYDTSMVKGFKYDPVKALALLDEAGYPNGEGLPNVTLSTWSSSMDLCEYIQKQLKDIGMNVKIEVNPASTHREMVANSGLIFFRGSWYADYPDAENYLALFYSPNFSPKGPNTTHFSDPKFDELYEQAKSVVNDSLRFELYRQMDQIIIEEAPIVALYYDENIQFYQNTIQGLECNAMGLLSLKRTVKLKAKPVSPELES